MCVLWLAWRSGRPSEEGATTLGQAGTGAFFPAPGGSGSAADDPYRSRLLVAKRPERPNPADLQPRAGAGSEGLWKEENFRDIAARRLASGKGAPGEGADPPGGAKPQGTLARLTSGPGSDAGGGGGTGAAGSAAAGRSEAGASAAQAPSRAQAENSGAISSGAGPSRGPANRRWLSKAPLSKTKAFTPLGRDAKGWDQGADGAGTERFSGAPSSQPGALTTRPTVSNAYLGAIPGTGPGKYTGPGADDESGGGNGNGRGGRGGSGGGSTGGGSGGGNGPGAHDVASLSSINNPGQSQYLQPGQNCGPAPTGPIRQFTLIDTVPRAVANGQTYFLVVCPLYTGWVDAISTANPIPEDQGRLPIFIPRWCYMENGKCETYTLENFPSGEYKAEWRPDVPGALWSQEITVTVLY